ncbi:MAG TPA: hypothetical protein VHK24_10940, partial [Steroidobacter sp.]|nr:hypothetical protein [Steroidobacter sp.]
MELLPAERDAQIFYRRGRLDAREIRKHDAVLVACERERAEELLARMPHAAHWRRAYEEACRRGSATVLSLRLPEPAVPVSLALFKKDACAFDRLTLAARAWKELTAPGGRVLLGALGFDADGAAAALEALLSAALAATAQMPSMKSQAPKPAFPAAFTVLYEGEQPDFSRTVATDRGNHLARWLTALPPNILDSAAYRRALRDLARRRGWEFSFLDEATLHRRGAGAFLAVARANEHREAGIVRLRCRAGKRGARTAHLALIGKGVCFDTGGVNLKTHKSMYHMHTDMQGSAVAVGTMLALSELGAPCDIDCWIAITENQIGARAFRPQEVVRAANGVTIQVAHSDAEGRMVLADALALAARESPDLMIDFATLTGACVVALG